MDRVSEVRPAFIHPHLAEILRRQILILSSETLEIQTHAKARTVPGEAYLHGGWNFADGGEST